MKHSNEKVLMLSVIVVIITVVGCATPGSSGGVASGQEIEEPAVTAQTAGWVAARTEEGAPRLEIDFSEYQRDGGSALEIHTVRLTVFVRNSGHVVFENEWRDTGWHGGRGNEERPESVWDVPDLPNEPLEVQLQIGSNRSASGERWFDSFLTFGPVEWDLSAGDTALFVTPYPWTETGSLTLRGINETGIGDINNGLGVFLSHEDGTASYHFHLQPGGEYLAYEGAFDRIKVGTYRVTVLAWKDEDWPYYGNAVLERSINVTSGGEAYVSGQLTEKIAPWNLNIELADFRLQNETLDYETAFDVLDPKMEGPHTYEEDEPRARLEDGVLIVSGTGNLSGGLDFDVRTGENSIVRCRVRMPEGGQFFINLRRWGPSRMAVLFTTESAEEGPVIDTFSTTEHGEIGGSNSGTYIPELANDRWYDYTLIDTGEELFVFIDDQFTLALPISDELPDAGQLGLEWHRPCIFDSLSVATVDGVTVPIAVQEIR